MDRRSLTGFRICIKLCMGDNGDSRKYFIFINEGWSKIKNVQDHIKNIFNIDEDVNIFIGDVLLPENETIKLIQLNDILMVRTVQTKKVNKITKRSPLFPESGYGLPCLDSPVIPVSRLKEPSEKLLSDCLEELRSKKEQIVKECEKSTDCVSNVNGSNEIEPLLEIPAVKKRKRKHKKKSKALETSSGEEAFTNNSDLIISDSSSKHIHFSDEDYKQLDANSSPKVMNGNTVEEFRSSLRHLANIPASQKIFSRKSETSVPTPALEDYKPPALHLSPITPEDENKSVAVYPETFVPKVGDLISFKKIKLGSDYTPQESKEIVGEVMTVEGSGETCLVVFTIKEGAEEFEDPSGKFSLEVEENDFKGDKIHVAEMRWLDVLEPHLKRRV